MRVEVAEVASPRQMQRFIEYPLELYAGDPIFEFTQVRYLLALDERRNVLGRMTAHVNRRHNEFAGESTGFFGFFESVERLHVARALTESAEDWLRAKGMSVIRGPFNFSTNQECGFLAWGFDRPPAIMMPYTKPYYLDFMAELGYSTAKDLVAYEYEYQGAIPDYIERFSRKVQDRANVVVRTIDMRNFHEDVRKVFSVYNKAWHENWGFVPMTEGQFRFIADSLKQIVDPALALIAEIDGEPVGFSLALPDYNPLFKKAKGRLFPFGAVAILLGRSEIHRVRVLTMGVVREHRKRGIDILLVYHTFRNGLPRGYRSAELSWILEDNVLLRRAMDRMGAKHSKTYRIFEKPL
jgi:GNAT superfamily N-acetyltransferase